MRGADNKSPDWQADDGQLTCSFLRDEWQTRMGANLSTPNSENKMSYLSYENAEHHTHLDTKLYSQHFKPTLVVDYHIF